MFNIEANRDILNKVFARFQLEWHIYQKMYWYYCGITDTNAEINFSSQGAFDDGIFDNFIDGEGIGNYSYVNDRYNKKVSTNFMKKFIKEEVSYSVGNDITYLSRSSNEDNVNIIKDCFAVWDADHESNLAKNMLIYGNTYELYYIDKGTSFKSKVISPRHGFAYTDDMGNIIFFMHIFRQKFDSKMYIDIYTDTEIIHCDEVFTEVAPRTIHPFGQVPVGIAQLSEEGWLDTIFRDIKGLQDSYEQNLSDISGEITDFRNAYLALSNCVINEEDLPKIKKMGIMQFNGEGSASWLTKNINDTFIQNTLNTLEEKMYKITSHVDTNEKTTSNVSSLALRAKLISLEEKCKLNEKALSNCVRKRLQVLFTYLNKMKNTNFDYRDIKVKFTPNIPSDDLITAQIISQIGDKLSTETGIAQLSFVDNPKEEMLKIEQEHKANSIGADLLNSGHVHSNGGV